MATGLISALALLGALAGAPAVPHVVVRTGSASIGADRAVGDVLSIDGEVEVEGVVRGYLFAVSSTVVLHKSAVVLSPMAMHGGRLVVEPGARLPSTVILAGTELVGALPEGVSAERTRAPSRAARQAMTRLLAFDRPVPGKTTAFDAAIDFSPGEGFVQETSLDDPAELVVGGVARLTFTSDRVLRVAQRSYRDATDRHVLFTAVELADDATGDAFWTALASVPERAVSSSVRTALGDGAHWWFVRRDRGCLLWHRGRWFFALETRAPVGAADPLDFTDHARIALTEHFEQGDQR